MATSMPHPGTQSTTPHKYQGIPDELKEYNQWLLWRLENKRKIPLSVAGRKTDPTRADMPFELVARVSQNSMFSGIGFSFQKHDPFVAIDYDHILDESGNIEDPEIEDEIQHLNSYTEISPSGTGLHVIVKGNRQDGWKTGARKGCRELYFSGRYFTITGELYRESPTVIREIEEDLLTKIYKKVTSNTSSSVGELKTTPPPSIQDNEIISRLQTSDVTKSLFAGDTTGYKSHSEADQALCNHIAFYTREPEQIDRIFSQSGLYREKWNREGYKNTTIETALSLEQSTFEPHHKTPVTGPDIITDPSELISTYSQNQLRLDLSGLPDDNLIMRYIDHQAKRTDAYKEYHHASACFLISTLCQRMAFSEFAQGVIHPNLWVMCLGASTVSRKSTAIDAAEEVLKRLGMPEGIPNGFSPESFIEIMADTPVNYLLADECGALLSNMQKNYMSDMRDLFCKLYDCKGYSRKLRTSQRKGQTSFEVKDPYISQLCGTTPGNFSEYSSQLDLTSGWLLRFIYYNPGYPKDFMPFILRNEELEKEFQILINGFREIKKFFNDHYIAFRPTPEALKIYQDWQRKMETKTLEKEDEIQLSGYGRLSVYVLKLAMIYTIADPAFLKNVKPDTGFYDIHPQFVEVAIKQIEEYFLLVFCQVADAVNRRESNNLQDKIVAFVKRKGGKCTRSTLLKYLHRRASDINSEIDTLIESGEITHKELVGKEGRSERWYLLL
ncbi:MAG: DUF3987 domain-containing protein [Methanogenium sp.]|nr:DUF3987 domain-containing protein [Methanogenium sp.]